MSNVALQVRPKLRPTRERIVRAGLMLFQAHGYHATGITEILGRAKAPRGSLYHHFPGGKEAVAIAAVRWLQAEVAAFLDQCVGSDEMVTGLARHSAEGLRH